MKFENRASPFEASIEEAPPNPAPAVDDALLERIRASLAVLPPAERRVAQLVLEDPRGFARSTVSRLAERAQVSGPTVVRFCRSVGYDGLVHFKRKLAGSLDEGVPFLHPVVDPEDGVSQLIVKLIDNVVAGMLRLRNEAEVPACERAIELLAKAARSGRRIDFYGVGNSGIVAQDAQHKFFRLGVHTAACSDGHVQLMAATMLRRGDCAVLISNSGRSVELLDAADIARRKGAATIAITADGSPLARKTQLLLPVNHLETPQRYSPMLSRLLHLTVIDVLATGLALRLGEAPRLVLREIKHNLHTKRKVLCE